MHRRAAGFFFLFALSALFLASAASAADPAVCRGCHGQPWDGKVDELHHAFYFQTGKPCADCHFPDGVTIYRDCATCHTVAVAHPDCLSCHSVAQGSRRAVAADFSMASHHVQASKGPTDADCRACHDLYAHGKGTVYLRSAEGDLPVAYTDAASATPACLACHDDNSKTETPFSDLKTPVSSPKNWDGKSIDIKYSTPEVVNSNKYPPTITAPYMGAPYNTVPDVARALSAHGNPAQNAANGTGADQRVPCLACHNAHGSPVAPLIYATESYTPASPEDSCWDCHTNDPGSPWKASQFMPGNWVKDYFADPRWGQNDGTGFKVNWMGSFAYKNSSFMSSHLYPSKRKISDTNWPRSVVTCTSCHDPHGVDPNLIAAKQYMVPLLKGTWMISPFKEDRAPLASFESPLTDGSPTSYSAADQPRSAPDLAYNDTRNPGAGHANGSGGSGHEGFFIEDNTFGVYDPYTQAPAASGSWRGAISRNQPLQTNRLSETDAQFAGLCLSCHPKADLQAAWPGHGTVKGWGGATRDLITSSMASSASEGPGRAMHAMGSYNSTESEQGAIYGRGYRWGVNPKTQQTSGYIQKDYHQFTCSKCHSPHATNMPRLLTTNCLDSKGTHTTYPNARSAQANNCHSTQRNLAWNTLTPWIQAASPDMYTIVATSNSGGTISPGGGVLVAAGASKTFTIAANAGFRISDVKVDNVSRGAITSYAFTNVTADHTITAIFASTGVNYTITASAGAGGTISPSGSIPAAAGTGQTFAFTPNDGSVVVDVIVDNVSQGPLATYTFGNINANHTIAVTFSAAYTITASGGTGGTISPAGNVQVLAGASQTFTITPALGYKIAGVTTDGVSRGAVSSYTFTNVTAAHTINATFSTIPTYALTATAGAGGTISPSGSVVVSSGASQTFTIAADPGFSIADVKVDNVSQGPLASYTFTNVTAKHSIAATFQSIVYTIAATAGAGGAVSPAGNVPVDAGTDAVFLFTPNPGYAVEDVKIDGVSWGPISNWCFGSVGSNHTIDVTFRAPAFTITASAGTGAMISPSGAVQVSLGQSKTFTIAAGLGYRIAAVVVDGISRGVITSYTFTNVTAAHTIEVSTATTPTYTLTAIAGTGGTVSPTGSVVVNSGATQTFTIAAGLGYRISDVKVDNVSQGALASYTFTNVTANHNISASFVAAPTYTLTASAGTGGTISPSGSVVVNSGASQTFAIAASGGYNIADVKVDNVSQGPVASYAFSNVTANHTISATFAAQNLAPTADAGADKSGTSGSAISFTGAGSDPDGTISGWSWNWGDGSANTNTQNASHTYAAAGTYTATLTVTDNLGATASDTAVVTVSPAPVNVAVGKTATASSQYSTTYSAAKAVDASTSTYWRSSSTGTQWLRVDLGSNYVLSNVKVLWSGNYYARAFQVQTSLDGTNFTSQYSTNSGASGTAEVTLASVGARYVRLSCTTANSSSYRVTELQVFGTLAPNLPPTANAGADKSGTSGSAISFTGTGSDPDGTIASWSWNWGDSTADTNTQNASHTYAAAGTYTATLTVTDNLGATATDTAVVTVAAAPPNQPPTANAGADKSGTSGSAISFTGAGSDPDGTIASWSWNWGDSTADTATQNASHTYAAAGTYTATLTVTDNLGATATDTAVVTVAAAPLNLAVGQPATASSEYSTTYSAAKAVDASTSTYWRSSSTGTQWLRVDLGSNYLVSNVKVVWNSTYYARAFQVQTSLDGTNFTSQYSTTSGASGTADVTFTAAAARYVRLSCTTENSSSYRVTEFEVYGTPAANLPPTANAGADKSGAPGAAISFTGAGSDPDGTIASWSWNWGDGTADTNTQNASHTYAAAGTYTATLTVTDNLGATATDTAVVTVAAAPAAVAQLNAWANLYAAAPNNSSATNLSVGSVTVGNGSNRQLLVAVVMELSAAANKTVSASLGGVALTQVGLTANTQREIVWVGRLGDTQIGSGAKTLTITYGGSGTVTGLHVKWASYSGVNQTTPVAGVAAQNTSSTSSTSFGATVSYANGGITFAVAGNGGSTATGTLSASPSFTAGTATQSSSHTSRTFVTAKHTAAGSYASSTAVSWSSGSTGSGVVAVSLQP